MKYDFTTIMDRHGKDALAVDALGTIPGMSPDAPKEGFDFIPMWIADMNFPTCPTICEAITERVKHPAFGYFDPSEDYYNAIINWHKARKGISDIKPEYIGYENGVLGLVASALGAFTAPGDFVLLHSPTYIGFTNTILKAGRRIIHSPLVQDSDGVWRMDYEDMDRKLKQYNIHFAIFCSPHNPAGRVWEKEEIEKAMEVYKANDVTIVSDEIWSDLILPGHKHIPTQSISEDAKMRTIGAYAPSKTFNLAGLVGSYHIIYNKFLRDRIIAQARTTHYNDMNVLSMHALIGAYCEEGHQWVDELIQVLEQNISYVYEYITSNFKGIKVTKPEGTYMMYLDCKEFCQSKDITMDELLKMGWDVGVGYQDGRPFNNPYGIRLNLALPHSRVVEAMDRLNKYVFGK